MNSEDIVFEEITKLGVDQFNVDMICEKVPSLTRDTIMRIMYKLHKSSRIFKVMRGIYSIKKTSVKLSPKDLKMNAVEMNPLFLKFGKWKVKDLQNLGFTLIELGVVAQADKKRKGGIKKWSNHISLSKNNSFVIKGIERNTVMMTLTRIPGDIYNKVSSKIISIYQDFSFNIRWIKLLDQEENLMLLVNYKKLLMLSQYNGRMYYMYTLDNLEKIAGDLYWKACKWYEPIRQKPFHCQINGDE